MLFKFKGDHLTLNKTQLKISSSDEFFFGVQAFRLHCSATQHSTAHTRCTLHFDSLLFASRANGQQDGLEWAQLMRILYQKHEIKRKKSPTPPKMQKPFTDA